MKIVYLTVSLGIWEIMRNLIIFSIVFLRVWVSYILSAWVLLGFLMLCELGFFSQFWKILGNYLFKHCFYSVYCLYHFWNSICMYIRMFSYVLPVFYTLFCVLARTGPGPQISSLWGCPWTGVLLSCCYLFELLPLLSLWSWLKVPVVCPQSSEWGGGDKHGEIEPYFSHPSALNILAWLDLAATEICFLSWVVICLAKLRLIKEGTMDVEES